MIKRVWLTWFLLVGLLFDSSCASPTGRLPSSPTVWLAGAPDPSTTPPLPPPTYTPRPTRTPLPTKSPIPSFTPSPTPTYREAFGIDYLHPEKYQEAGRQTRIDDPNVVAFLRPATPGVPQLEAIFQWLHVDFTAWRAGGSTIGAVTAAQLLQKRRLGGCHDYALVFAAAARQLGYPAVIVDAVDLDWAQRAARGKTGEYSGHVFVEVYFQQRWVLIDSTNGSYVWRGYDPANPVIPLKAGYYVMRKGVDTWSYGIHSNQELQKLMDQTAAHLAALPGPPVAPTYEFKHFQ